MCGGWLPKPRQLIEVRTVSWYLGGKLRAGRRRAWLTTAHRLAKVLGTIWQDLRNRERQPPVRSQC